MLSRLLESVRLARDLGRAYWMSRDPHIQERLPSTHPQGAWVVFACRQPVTDGPVYATPSMRAVQPGERYWIFVEEGDYWLYALRAERPDEALRAFYADPQSALLLNEGSARSFGGFREDKK